MEEHKEHHMLPIWFFIGITLLVYGVVILGSGIYEWIKPPEKPVAMAHLHAAVWWGILMVVVGLIYTIKFRPTSPKVQAKGEELEHVDVKTKFD